MKTLYSCDFALDILSLHLKIPDVLFDAVQLLTEYDCETVGGSTMMGFFLLPLIPAAGDPQTAVSHLGNIVLFVQMLLTKFRVRSRHINAIGNLTTL